MKSSLLELPPRIRITWTPSRMGGRGMGGDVGKGTCRSPWSVDVSAEQLLSEIWVGTGGSSPWGPVRILGQETRGWQGGGGLEAPCFHYSMKIAVYVRGCPR